MEQEDNTGNEELSRRQQVLRRLGVAGAVLGLTLSLSGDARAENKGLPVGQYNLVAVVGDSYASGLGAKDDDNECRRSPNGYAGLIARALQAKLEIIACSGASPKDVVDGEEGSPSQVEQIPSDADLVVITVGGNAVNLREFGNACLKEGCGPGSEAYEKVMRVFKSPEYADILRAVYLGARKAAPSALIGVIGYPKMVAEGVISVSGSHENDRGIEEIATVQNGVAEGVIRGIGDPRIVYIEPAADIDVVSTKIANLFNGMDVAFYINPQDTTRFGHLNSSGHSLMAAAALGYFMVRDGDRQLDFAR